MTKINNAIIAVMVFALTTTHTSNGAHHNYKKIALISGASLGILATLGTLYYYFLKPRSHEQEIAYQQEQCAKSDQACSLIYFEYEQMIQILKKEPHERFSALKSLIVERPGSRPFITFTSRVADDRQNLQDCQEILKECKKELVARSASLAQENNISTAAHFTPQFSALEKQNSSALTQVTTLIHQLQILERMAITFNEYHHEKLQERLEKIEAEIRELQYQPRPLPVHIHHFH